MTKPTLLALLRRAADRIGDAGPYTITLVPSGIRVRAHNGDREVWTDISWDEISELLGNMMRNEVLNCVTALQAS